MTPSCGLQPMAMRREPCCDLLRRGRNLRAKARLGVVEAGHRPHTSIARPYGAYRPRIIGDPKYFNKENWGLPGGIQKRLHLLARRIVIPHPRGGVIDATAPLPPHMLQSWNLLGLEADRFDPIENAPEE